VSTLLWQFAALLVGTVLLFAALSAGMALLTRRLGPARLRRWVGGGPVAAPVKGLLLGVVTPFCSWSMVPVLTGLLRSRVRTSAVAAFFLASPVLDPVLVVLLAWLFGPWVAVWFVVFLTVAILASAVLAERLRLERHVLPRVLAPVGGEVAAPVPAGDVVRAPDGVGADGVPGWGSTPATAAACGTDDELPWRGPRTETPEAVRAAVEQMRHLLLPLAVTCAVAVLIAGTSTQQLLADLAGPGSPYAIPAAAVLGAPLYLPTEALAPLGWGLRDVGVGPGPVFAFLVTAASLNLPEVVLLTRVLRLRLVAAVVATVLTLAVVGALVVPLLVTG
jgi:uncharacterized membrane protein YraQ (UPF0718 family)